MNRKKNKKTVATPLKLNNADRMLPPEKISGYVTHFKRPETRAEKTVYWLHTKRIQWDCISGYFFMTPIEKLVVTTILLCLTWLIVNRLVTWLLL